MNSTVDVFEQQATGYDRYVREHWQSLEQWERDYHTTFKSWATDRRNVRRFVSLQIPKSRNQPKSWNESLVGTSMGMRTISFSYALLLSSIFFFPIVFAAIAAVFGFINSLRGRWDHGLIQIILAAAVVAAFVNGVSLSSVTYDFIERTANLIS